jgi:hypothetical protein
MGARTNGLWTIWIDLSAGPRMFLFLLAIVAIYTLFVAVSTEVRLWSLAKSTKPSEIPHSVEVLQARLANTKQVIAATFYLFGVVLFIALKNAYWTMGSNKPVGVLILDNFFVDFVFAANVFGIFLLLHSVQWFSDRRVRSYVFRRNSQAKEMTELTRDQVR